MFAGCSNLTSLNLSTFDTSNVINMWEMFLGCSNLTKLDLSNFDMSNITGSTNMFSGVPSTIKIKTNSATAEYLKADSTNITDENIEIVS